MEGLRITRNFLQVLRVLSSRFEDEHYALELAKEARVSVGSIYALLSRLEEGGLVKSDLEGIDPSAAGRPQRRYYRLTASGVQQAAEILRREGLGLPGGVAHV